MSRFSVQLGVIFLSIISVTAIAQQAPNSAQSSNEKSGKIDPQASTESESSPNTAQRQRSKANPLDDGQQIKVFQLQHADGNEMVRMLKELGVWRGENTTITVRTDGQTLVMHGPRQELEVIELLLLRLDEPSKKKVEKDSRKISAVFNVEFPKGATLRWIGGQGGITSSIQGVSCFIPAGGSNKLWLSKIPGNEKLSVIANVEVRQIDAETGAILNSNPTSIRITKEDLEQLVTGSEVMKVIYGPNDMASGRKGLFEEVVSYRLPAGTSSISEIEKAKNVVAVIRLSGTVHLDANAADVSQPITRSPAIAESKPRPADSLESSIRQLTNDFAQAESLITEVSQKLRSEHDQQSASAGKLRQQLLDAVSSAFELRQKLQIAQIELQRVKLDVLHARVLQREKTSKQIIERRMKDLATETNRESIEDSTKTDRKSIDREQR